VLSQIALHVDYAAPPDKTVLIDAFAGAGGNTIAFALSGRWEQIFAIEKDPETLKCAKRNAEIYGVSKKIWWINGDCFDILKTRLKVMGHKAIIFASPPWGGQFSHEACFCARRLIILGPSYTDDEIFDLSRMEPYSIKELYSQFSKITKDIVLYLPRNSNLNQVAPYIPDDQRQQSAVIHYCMQGASKVSQ
jgi:trimethylguanosine synthase